MLYIAICIIKQKTKHNIIKYLVIYNQEIKAQNLRQPKDLIESATKKNPDPVSEKFYQLHETLHFLHAQITYMS